ncbi:PREDICTED: ESF1 homolog isoform X2 [Cyprinodon variegatus]|uniref:ESF1 homolog isoform X2 n=1 Tax=Cyprinodon variegatus TaxID=28743 RepID=UPI0007425E15|nr:PREDICTED: ESF1 homolog isoform X2 [Cyprinodon variegatus]
MSRKKQEEDERFRRVQKDPRFWEMPEKEQKVKIDKRFQSMFHDQRFKVKQTVDKRGRPVSHSTSEDLRRFYKLSDSDEDDDDEPPKVGKGEKKKTKAVEPSGRGTAAEKDDEDEEQLSEDEDLGDSDSDENGEGYEEEEESDAARGSDDESSLDSGDDSDSGPDLARGKGNIETSSDEDDDDDDVEDILKKEEEEIEHDWGELCKDAPRSDEVSARIAVCNMDWDRMKAKDLLALFNSFTPKGGAVLSVKIYPSEFGKERLKMEETQGPPELKALPDDSEDDTEEEKVYREKLRDYQFKRLKYFYAVVECDSPETAAKIYEECDGYEYESSCSVLDLRFIPDDVMFEEEPKDVATDINLSAYQPKLFTSSATATSKVQLTWDETDHERVTALSRKFNKDELLDLDFKAYLASSSEEDEDEEQEDEASKEAISEEVEEKEKKRKKKERSEEQINKYRELLNSIQVKEKKLQEEKDMEMEITWVPGLRETTEKLVKKKLEGKDNLTPWEEYLEKKKEKKKQKKSKKKQGADEELSDDELPSDVDLSDPFFSEELGTSDLKKKQKKKKEEKKTEDKKTTVEEEEELEKQKAEMALLMEDDEDEAKHKHFNYDKIVEQQNLSKKKRKKLLKKGGESLEEDDFKVDVSDPRFQAMFTSHLFNLDPSHPSFKKTKATQSILEEKHRRRELGLNAQKPATASEAAAEPGSKQEGAKREKDSLTQKKAMDPSLSLLVKSIKSKTEQFQARKKQKVT